MKHNGHRMNPAAGRSWQQWGAFDRPEPRKSTERRATEIVTPSSARSQTGDDGYPVNEFYERVYWTVSADPVSIDRQLQASYA